MSIHKRDHLILQNAFIPSSLEDKYSLILASLDVLSNAKYTYKAFTQNIDIRDPTIDLESIPEISHRTKIIENMKDAWSKFSASNLYTPLCTLSKPNNKLTIYIKNL